MSPLLWLYVFKVDGKEVYFYDRSLDDAKQQFEEKYKRAPLKSDFVRRDHS